jgi:beta-N-acetylhexosaminidase
VSRLAVAFIKGCQEYGLIATAKHFPGHGDTDLDSHIQLPVVRGDRDRLDKVELYPFKRAIEGGVQAIMTAHLHVPALDPTPDLPATLSPLILTELLRKELGFKGIIVTDAMNMGGITASYSAEEAAIRAVQAGADMILLPPGPHGVIDALIQAVRSGQIPSSSIDASVKRILEAKARLGLHKNRLVEEDSLATIVASKEYLELAARMFENSITLVKNEGNILPLSGENLKIAVFSLSSDPGDYFAGRTFIKEIEKRCPQAVSFYADPYTGQEYIQEGVAKAQEADTVIFALFSSPSARKGSVDLDPKHIQLVKDFAHVPAKIIVVSFGSPYFLRHFPEVACYLCAYRSTDKAQIAAAKALFGEIDIKGKLPVTLPDLYPFGHGLVLPKIEKSP